MREAGSMMSSRSKVKGRRGGGGEERRKEKEGELTRAKWWGG